MSREYWEEIQMENNSITYDCANCLHSWEEETRLTFNEEKCPKCKSWAIAETNEWNEVGWDHL